MRRVDRQRRQHREYLVKEVFLQPGQFILEKLIGSYALDAFLLQQGHEFGQALLLVLLQSADLKKQLFELLFRRPAVRAFEQRCLREPGRLGPQRAP